MLVFWGQYRVLAFWTPLQQLFVGTVTALSDLFSRNVVARTLLVFLVTTLVSKSCLEKAKSTERPSPGSFYHMSSFSFYVILLFATVTRIVPPRKALTSLMKNRIICRDQKWPRFHRSVSELSYTQCRFTSHIGTIFRRLTGFTVIKLCIIFLFWNLKLIGTTGMDACLMLCWMCGTQWVHFL